MKPSRTLTILAALSLPLTSACSAPKPEPEIASSAGQAGYATGYPEAVQSISKRFGKEDDEARTLASQLASYPDQVETTDWAKVKTIVQQADQAGRSQAYVERTREVEGARTFFDEERDEIVKKVGGAATYVVKQKGCEVEVSGTISHALGESIDKQLEERMRSKNEAHLTLDRNRAAFGKEASAALGKQIDAISRASYLAHIAMVEEKVRLNALLAEAETVKKTLDDFIETEKRFAAEPGRTDAEKKASEERRAKAHDTRQRLDGETTRGKELASSIEQRIADAQKRHADAVSALLQKIDAKGGAKGAS